LAPHHPKERGAALVELAVALPLLLIILFGIIEAGFAINAQITVRHAASEAARLGAVAEPITPACDQLDLTNRLISPGIAVTATGSVGSGQIIATASGDYDPVTGFFPFFNGITISQTATARMEQPGGGGGC
jgi:Flp pilus assembly protein TadG